MDQEERSVFYSSEQISSYNDHIDDKFSDLITITPAEPSCSIRVPVEKDFSPSVTRLPRNIEFRKRSMLKVKTVAEIRRAFDEHTYKYLPEKLEKIEKYFLKRIRQGASEDVETICTARNVLNNEDPISRAAWRMLTRLNVDNYLCDTQYIKFNKRKIRLNGSRGGQAKVLKLYENSQIVSEDLVNFELKPKIQKKYGLLQQSLNVAFRPGPLCKKTGLDDSFQKKNIGKALLVDLPEVGLEIKPKLGVPLEPVAYNIVQEKRSPTGVINEEWAIFSVAAVAEFDEKSNITFQTSSHIFKLPFRNNQNRILMRKDYENKIYTAPCEKKNKYRNEKPVLTETVNFEEVGQDVRDVLNNLITAVEISTSQESFFSQETDYEPVPNVNTSEKSKTKLKKKYANELARLDITVIQMSSDESLPACTQGFCKLGCICSSLDCQLQFGNHCGKVDCMFDCECQYQSRKNNEDPYSLIPGIINIKNKVTASLAKEEKKFHQTVVFSKNEPIVLGSKRRFTRAPKRYAEFIYTSQGKELNKLQQLPKVNLSRVALDNVAPWCLVHQLYRCFCKNKYSESLYTYPLTYNATPTEDIWSEMPVISEPRMPNYKVSPIKKEIIHYRRRLVDPKRLKEFTETLEASDEYAAKSRVIVKKTLLNEDMRRDSPFLSNCSRTLPIDEIVIKGPHMLYYKARNERIRQLESKDKHLKHLLERFSGISDETREPVMFKKRRKLESISQSLDKETEVISSDRKHLESLKKKIGIPSKPAISPLMKSASKTSQIVPRKTKHHWIATSIKREKLSEPKLNFVQGPRFIKWLEKNYINIRSQPIRSLNLGEPKNNKVSLYPWTQFQKRYTDRKNVFLVSVTSPFRLFLTLTTDIDTLKDCISIDSINRGQLDNYPLIISDLILRVEKEDCFVILNGRTDYWEAVGTVVKSTNPSPVANSDIESDTTSDYSSNYSDNSLLTPMFETRLGNAEVTQCEEQRQTPTDSTSSTDQLQSDLEVQSMRKMKTYSNKSKTGDTETITKKNIVPQRQAKNVNDESTVDKCPDLTLPLTSSIEQSRWFVLTVENDFSEIRFYNEGFFVKQANIMKAISLAQRSGETVALPNQSVYELNGTIQPKFGIYAVPLFNKNCVLLGPYDLDQILGIETLCYNRITEKKTRGFWIYTHKADNLKVIENPLHFISQGDSSEIVINPSVGDSEDGDIITKQQFINLKDFVSDEMCNVDKPHIRDSTCNEKIPLNSTAMKKTFVFESKLKPGILQKLKKMSPKKIEQVRPITIKKDNGFYRVAGQLLNKSVSILKPPENFTQANSFDKCLQQDCSNTDSPLRKRSVPSTENTKKKPKTGLYILKPDQINDIINQNAMESAKTDHTYSFGDFVEQEEPSDTFDITHESKDESIQLVNTFSEDNDVSNKDSSNNHETSTSTPNYVHPNHDFNGTVRDDSATLLQENLSFEKTQDEADVVCISSDEESEEEVFGEGAKDSDIPKCFKGAGEAIASEGLKVVDRVIGCEKVTKKVQTREGEKGLVREAWLVCRTVESLGFIKSKRRDNLICFQFPGFKESEYFTPATAFDKINQLLARKVFVPPGTELDWEVVTNKADVEDMEMLNIKYLKAEYVLTKNGLHHSKKFISQHTDEIKEAVALLGHSLLPPEKLAKTEQWKLIIMAPDVIKGLKEEESKLLKQKKILKKELNLKKKKHHKLIEDKRKLDEPTEIDIDSFIEGAATVARHEN